MRKGFLAGLVLLLAGVYLLNLGVYVWDAGLCLGLGLLILGVTLCRVFYPPAPKTVVSAPMPLAEWFATRRKGVWRGVALGLALLVGVLARRKAPDSDFTAVLGLWLLALGLFRRDIARARGGAFYPGASGTPGSAGSEPPADSSAVGAWGSVGARPGEFRR